MLRWGVLGTGWIAEKFTAALRTHTSQQVLAVGSRTPSSAQAAAARFGAERAYGSYEELVADPDLDIVYVATPHNYHHPHALLALRAGHHVLVEKPLALNATMAREIADTAEAAGLFCMEAFWSFFLPKWDVIGQLLADGVLGDLRFVAADHGQHFESDHRILRKDLAGGPMLDLMTYPAGFAHWLLGAPSSVSATATWLPSGVTGQTAIMLTTESGAQAQLHSSVEGPTPTTASVGGTAAQLFIDGDFYVPGDFRVRDVTGAELSYTEPAIGHEALFWQAAEAARRIAAGETGSPLRTVTASIETLQIMDEARRQIGECFAEEI